MTKSNKGLISVVMPAYNADKFLEDSVKSVLSQTYTNIELIIVDDCSTDTTYTIMRKLSKKNDSIHILQNPSNSGVAKSRNLGIENAKGDWIAFLDSDDMWEKTKLEKQLALLCKIPQATLIYTGVKYIDEQGNNYNYSYSVPERTTYHELLKQNIIACSSVLVKKEVILRYKMQNDDLHEDFISWLLILKEDTYAYGINEPLLVYRISKTSKSGNKKKSVLMTYKVYRFIGLMFIQSVYYLCFYMYRNYVKYKNIQNS
ncbi:MAG: glycosyltransferase family 2 protein [Clostridiales bacterium]|nr:glycosyltransferase family 2 protein [Clostridiales bacterium]